MKNLLIETEYMLETRNLSKEDVRWCGSESFGWFDWATFAILANKEYDHGYGGQEVCADLVIVGNDWWLERREYDGSEWWEYKTMPRKPKKITPRTVFADGTSWESLESANKGDNN